MTIPPLSPARDHNISAAEAADLTRRHRQLESSASDTTGSIAGTAANLLTTAGSGGGEAARTPEQGAIGGLFSKKAVLSLLSRADAQFLRYYHARDSEGKRALVLVAADANGNDLLDGGAQTLDHHWPCPPYCPTEASALRG